MTARVAVISFMATRHVLADVARSVEQRERVAVDVGVQQFSESIGEPGNEIVCRLPDEVLAMTAFAAGRCRASRNVVLAVMYEPDARPPLRFASLLEETRCIVAGRKTLRWEQTSVPLLRVLDQRLILPGPQHGLRSSGSVPH